MINVGLIINSIDPGGAQIHILNYINTLKKTGKFKFTIIYFESKNIELTCKFHSLSIDTILLDSRTKLDRFLLIYKHLKNGNYDVIHSHMNRSNLIVIFAAFFAGIKKRISHSHSSIPQISQVDRSKQIIIALLLFIFSTDLLACSYQSGKYLYAKWVNSKKFNIINNGVLPEDFCFSNESRQKTRLKLDIPDDYFLIGHIGDFSENKNRDFIKKISQDIQIQNLKIKFIFLGGDNDLFINSYPKSFKLIGNVDNSVISEYYSAMDLFLLPSLYEGIPFTIIESQYNGLNSIISNNLDKSVIFTKYVTSLSLSNFDEWIDKIAYLCKSKQYRVQEIIKNKNYDIRENSKSLVAIYSNDSV